MGQPHTWTRFFGAFAVGGCLALPTPGSAQITPVGGTVDMIAGFPIMRGTDTAHDPVNRVYLEVSAYGPVAGRFLNEAGVAVTAPFTIAPGTSFAHYPRAIYSPHINGGTGGFLVVWPQNDGPIVGQWPSNVVHGRTVSFAATPVLGADIVIGSSPSGVWAEAAPVGAYSTTSQQFLVAWQTVGSYEIHAVRVNAAGQPLGAAASISDAASRDPSVAWNPNTNEFGVSYGGWDTTSATVTFTRVRASDGAVLRRNVIYRAAGSFLTDVVFNAALGTFVVAYAAPGTRTSEVNAAGDVVTHGLTATTVGTYDGLSIAYNAVSGTHMLVGHYTKEIGGVELDGHGAKIGVEQVVTAGGAANGSFYPRVSGNTQARLWHISYARDFAAAASQLVTTGTVGGPVDTDGDGVPDSVDACPTVFAQTANGCPAPTGTSTGDVSGDGKPDVVFQHQTTGTLYSWWLVNGQLVGESLLNPSAVTDTNWLIVSKDDFTGDGQTDLLWQNQATGDLTFWRMQGVTLVQNIPIPIVTPWRVVATPDLNRDGYPDIVWQLYSSGALYVWILQRTANGIAIVGEGPFVNGQGQAMAPAGAEWRVVAAGDLNSDGAPDLLWQNQIVRSVTAWYLGGANGLTVVNGSIGISGAAGPWRVRMLNDMNSDGKLDIVWQNAVSASRLYVWFLNGAGGLQGDGYLGPNVALPPAWRVVGGK